MKKGIILLVLIFLLSIQRSDAQIGAIIRGIISRAIRAIDLQVQRIQTETIWLQDAQKVVENTMHQLKLSDIADWSDKQRTLYANYYQELWEVKNLIGTYQKVKDIIQKQTQLVNSYRQAVSLFKQDSHFTAAELDYMEKVYSGIIDQTVQNLEQVVLVTSAFSTQMSDAQRLSIINTASGKIDQHFTDLQQFNQQNIQLSLQRAKDRNELNTIQQLYGLQ